MKSSIKTLLPSVVILLALTLCVTDAMAQGGNGGEQKRGGRNGIGKDNPEKLLRNEAVQRELELTEDQIKSLEAANDRQSRDSERELREAELEGLSETEQEERRRELDRKSVV